MIRYKSTGCAFKILCTTSDSLATLDQIRWNDDLECESLANLSVFRLLRAHLSSGGLQPILQRVNTHPSGRTASRTGATMIASSSFHGTTCCISTRNTRLRVVRDFSSKLPATENLVCSILRIPHRSEADAKLCKKSLKYVSYQSIYGNIILFPILEIQDSLIYRQRSSA